MTYDGRFGPIIPTKTNGMRRESFGYELELEIVPITRYFGSISRKLRDVSLELPYIGCLFVRYLEESS